MKYHLTVVCDSLHELQETLNSLKPPSPLHISKEVDQESDTSIFDKDEDKIYYEVLISPFSDVNPGDVGEFIGIHEHTGELVLKFNKMLPDPHNMNFTRKQQRQLIFPRKHVRRIPEKEIK